MSLTYLKAKIDAVLTVPPTKPRHIKGTPRDVRLRELRAYRVQLAKWRRMEALLDRVKADTSFRVIDNGPAAPGQHHGTGTLYTPKGSEIVGRVTDCSIVHANPNRAQRRAVGGRRVASQRRKLQQLQDVQQAKANIANGVRFHGRWYAAGSQQLTAKLIHFAEWEMDPTAALERVLKAAA